MFVLNWILFLTLPLFTRSVIHDYYIGKYENVNSMSVLMRRALRETSQVERKEEMLSVTMTYPFELGPYGGVIRAIHIRVYQTTLMGRLYITHGHIGGTEIELIAEADHATVLEANYTVYGDQPFKRRSRVKSPKRHYISHEEL